MKQSERIAIVQRLTKEISSRYDFPQAESFLKAFFADVHTYFDGYEDVEQMVSRNLLSVPDPVLGEMIDDLGIESATHIAAAVQRPAVWSDDAPLRAFISHLSKEKLKATRLRDSLAVFGISGFVAHEDIEPTQEWQVQIERALQNMEVFISIHTDKFSESVWTQQEIGFAVARGIKVIAIRMGEDPKGFISKHQALSRGVKKAEEVAAEIDILLLKDERTQARYSSAKAQAALDLDVPF